MREECRYDEMKAACSTRQRRHVNWILYGVLKIRQLARILLQHAVATDKYPDEVCQVCKHLQATHADVDHHAQGDEHAGCIDIDAGLQQRSNFLGQAKVISRAVSHVQMCRAAAGSTLPISCCARLH